MKRTKFTSEQIQNYVSVITARARLSEYFGKQYSGKRDIYETLGYPKDEILYQDYLGKYIRQDIAAAIIDRPIKTTWSGDWQVIEVDDDEETVFEKSWKELYDNLKLKDKFLRVDRLSSIGRYGVLLLGIADGKQLHEPFEREGNQEIRLNYVKPLGEGSALILNYDNDPKSKRFGLPNHYSITITSATGGQGTTRTVHHSRVIHITKDKLESEVLGMPVLEKVYNRLIDLEKLTGGSAEMFWKGARPGYSTLVKDDYELGEIEEKELAGQIDEYEHNLRRFLTMKGIDIKALESQVHDPSKHVDIQLQMISAITGIPKRVLVGSERGELSSSQDADQWYSLIDDRRDEVAFPLIIKPFVDKMIEYGVLPEPSEENGYSVLWSNLYNPSEKDKAEIGRTRAEALRAYTANLDAQDVIPADVFLEYMLGVSQDELQMILQARENRLEEPLTEEERRLLGTENNEE